MSGGIRVIAIYAKALNEMGHDVLVVSPSHRKVSFFRKIRLFIRARKWPSTCKPASHFDGLKINHKVLDHSRPVSENDLPDGDVVIATWWETAEWVNALSDAKGAKAYFIQGHEVHSYLPVSRSKATYHLPFHKIVVAAWLQDVMRTEYGDSVVDLVSNSVDHDQFFSNTRCKRPVATMGFLYSSKNIKGVDVTLKAINLLRDRFSNIRVIAFGVEAPSLDSDIDTRIEFYLSPEQEYIRELYAQCDVWLTASRSEGFNLPAMEAMACRTPVVSTRTGWPEEAIVNGKNGFLVDVDDFAALAEAVAAVISLTDDAWQEMSQNAFDTVKNSSWQTSANLFENALRHACKRAKNGEISGTCGFSLPD